MRKQSESKPPLIYPVGKRSFSFGASLYPGDKNQQGQALLIANVFIAVLILFSLALVNATLGGEKTLRQINQNLIALNLAEAGIEKALWCLNQSEGTYCGGQFGENYTGETNVALGDGVFGAIVTTLLSQTKKIESTGFYPSSSDYQAKQTIRVLAKIDTDEVNFHYAVQIGEDGLQMNPNSWVIGNIYSNGNVIGSGNTEVIGDVWVAGGTSLVSDQEWTVHNNDFIFGQSSPKIDVTQSFKPSITDVLNKISIYIKKVGNPSSRSIKIVSDNNGVPSRDVLASAVLDASKVTTEYGWLDISMDSPPSLAAGTKYWIIIDAARQSSKYWIWGQDAFDDYPDGTGMYSPDWDTGSPEWTAAGGDFNFKTWMGGIITKIDAMTVSIDARANTIANSTIHGDSYSQTLESSTVDGSSESETIAGSTIGGNATAVHIDNSTIGGNVYCETITNSTVGGETFCPTSVTPPSDPGTRDFPISEAQIAKWKSDAEAGGTIIGDFSFEGETASLGPQKITGNLRLFNGQTLTVTGTIYVAGNVDISNNSVLALYSAYGANSGVILSDGFVKLNNNVTFQETAEGGKIMLVSNAAGGGALNSAIELNNNVSGAIFYAPQGLIYVYNNVEAKQLSGKKIILDNNVTLTYEAGLASINFTSGPSGGWVMQKGTWQKIFE